MPRVAAVDFPSRSTHDRLQKAVQRHDAHRAMGFWHSALSATKGLFSPPPPRVGSDDAAHAQANLSVPPLESRRKQLRKATSTPSLKVGQSVHSTVHPALPVFPANNSLNASPRKFPSSGLGSNNLKPISKLKISSPSPPQPLANLSSVHPKFIYPISPIPSPVGSCFPPNGKIPQDLSPTLPINSAISENTSSTDNCRQNESGPVRRRTKSAPGVKFTKRALSSYFPGLSPSQGSEDSELSSPIIIDIASPSIASPGSTFLPSPPLEGPKVTSEYFSSPTSVPQLASPRSFTSVKRKPVPRHLYSESLDVSIPRTPLLTPTPGTPDEFDATLTPKGNTPKSLNTPLLPPSEVILKSCTRNKNINCDLLPIGEGRAIKTRHRRSVSANGYGKLLGHHSNDGQAIPWYTATTSRILTPLSIPTGEQSKFSDGLPAPPRSSFLSSTPSSSDSTSVCSSVERNGAMSPLTDDEISAIRIFLRRHATGTRARQRRRARSNQIGSEHSRNSSVRSGLYDMHAQILNSYQEEDEEFYSAASSEEDLESHPPMSISDGRDSLTSLLHSDRDIDLGDCDILIADADAETEAYHEEAETSIDITKRGTFGYYNIPMIRRSSSRLGMDGLAMYLTSNSIKESHLEIPKEWIASANAERDEDCTIRCPAASDCTKEDDHEYKGDTFAEMPPRALSLSDGSSVEYTPRMEGESHTYDDGQRTSCEPLIPRMLHSDSESDRPISSSSDFSSCMSSISTKFSSKPGIGLAIMPPEQFANFDKYESTLGRDSPCSSSGCSEGSPSTLPYSSRREQYQKNVEIAMSNLSARFSQLQEDLSNLHREQDTTDSVRDSELGDLQRCVRVGVTSPVLKPALQIRPVLANRQNAVDQFQLPSPTDTVATYPPQTYTAQNEEHMNTSASADEGTPLRLWSQTHNDSEGDSEGTDYNFAVKSFMHLTPNESGDEGSYLKMKKRSRARLRQLFSRAALKTTSGRK